MKMGKQDLSPDFDNKFIGLKYFSGIRAVEFKVQGGASPRGLLRVCKQMLAGLFYYVLARRRKHKVPRLVLTASRLGAALGMTECLRGLVVGN